MGIKKSVLLVALVVILIFIAGCQPPAANTKTSESPSTNTEDKPAQSTDSPKTEEKPETVAPESYKLEYCRDYIKRTTQSYDSLKTKIELKEADITEINSDIENAKKVADAEKETEKKKELAAEEKALAELKEKLTKADSDRDNAKSKCSKLEKSADSSVFYIYSGNKLRP